MHHRYELLLFGGLFFIRVSQLNDHLNNAFITLTITFQFGLVGVLRQQYDIPKYCLHLHNHTGDFILNGIAHMSIHCIGVKEYLSR